MHARHRAGERGQVRPVNLRLVVRAHQQRVGRHRQHAVGEGHRVVRRAQPSGRHRIRAHRAVRLRHRREPERAQQVPAVVPVHVARDARAEQRVCLPVGTARVVRRDEQRRGCDGESSIDVRDDVVRIDCSAGGDRVGARRACRVCQRPQRHGRVQACRRVAVDEARVGRREDRVARAVNPARVLRRDQQRGRRDGDLDTRCNCIEIDQVGGRESDRESLGDSRIQNATRRWIVAESSWNTGGGVLLNRCERSPIHYGFRIDPSERGIRRHTEDRYSHGGRRADASLSVSDDNTN